MTMTQESYYTAKELAEELRLNVMTIYRWIESNKISAYKIGKEFRITKEEYERFLKSVKTGK